MLHAKPAKVSVHAKRRQRDELGTLGSGNHYLEVDRVTEIFADDAARVFGLGRGDAVVLIHCGSRGLGHRGVFADVVPAARLDLLFDVSHNTCKVEDHGGRQLFV